MPISEKLIWKHKYNPSQQNLYKIQSIYIKQLFIKYSFKNNPMQDVFINKSVYYNVIHMHNMQKPMNNIKTVKPVIKITYDPSRQQNLSNTLYHYKSCMILACVGDTIGYKNGKWEFNYKGEDIQKQLNSITHSKGINALYINEKDWKYSDDTVMHIATAQALLESKQNDQINQICRKIAYNYKICVKDMPGRAPGKTTLSILTKINQDGSNWNTIQFNPRGWGCGGSMRAACIGLAYFNEQVVEKLVAISIESARITHHNPIGYLGSLMSAYFTSLAIQRVNPKLWMKYFYMKALIKARNYIQKSKREVKQNFGKDWTLALQCIKRYCDKRKIPYDDTTQITVNNIEPFFPQNFDKVKFRQQEWKDYGFDVKWVGSLGLDSALIAFDAFLYSKGNYQKLASVAFIHGGDNDSTGTIAGAWYGAYYGGRQVNQNHYIDMEGYQVVKGLGKDLFNKYCNRQNRKFIGHSQMIK